MMEPFNLEFGGIELATRVEPLWLQLRDHHMHLAEEWAESILAMDFHKRFGDIATKGVNGLFVAIAVEEECDIGYAVFSIDQFHNGEIDSMFVRGGMRSTGVGTKLADVGLRWFADHRVNSIQADVHCANSDAIRFYQRLGFRPRMLRMIRTNTNHG